MAPGVGRRLLGHLRGLSADTGWTVATEETGTGSSWHLGGSTWNATVTVEPARWIGLEFELRDPSTGKRVSYDIDTDLYDIGQDEQREFADEIESDIIEFLDNLRCGEVLRGSDGSKLVLVLPRGGSYVRVTSGRFITSTSTHSEMPTTRGHTDYVPVT